LPTAIPREFAVRDVRQDAWTMYAEETIGRVWLVRQTDGDVAPDEARVDVYATTCPHLGCAIQLDAVGKKFVCPCHKAGFRLSGERLGEKDLGHKNPAPRDMDSLDSHTAFLFDKINFLMDATVGFININQNKVIQRLTVLSVVFMPLNVLAGIGGMSEFSMMTQGIPWEVSYGLFTIGLVLVGWLTYVFLKFIETRQKTNTAKA